MSWEFDNYKFDNDCDPGIFYLSHYGLPEPIDVIPPRRSQWHLWLAAGSGVLLFGMFVCWRLARHPAPAGPRPAKGVA
jgi:hypothetical protein